MDIILQGDHNSHEMVESLAKVMELFKDRYQIEAFCEIHLHVTLIDAHGDVVELRDSETNQAYRVFEVYRNGYELSGKRGIPQLHLVVDNTNK